MAHGSLIFKGAMVRAMLSGDKTETRRILKDGVVPPRPRHDNVHPNSTKLQKEVYLDSYCGEKKTVLNPRGMSREWCWWTRDDRPGALFNIRWTPGDLLYVRENFWPDPPACDQSWSANAASFVEFSGCGSPVRNVPIALRDWTHVIYAADQKHSGGKWKPSIHMPVWASRITLLVRDVSVERLQDITDSGAIAEGATARRIGDTTYWSMDWSGDDALFWEPRLAFAAYINRINGPDTWMENPFCAVIRFRVYQSNISKVTL